MSGAASAMLDQTGQVQTVQGLIPAERLGVTLPHEHLFVDLTRVFDPPKEAGERERAFAPFAMENLGWIRYNYFRHRDNLLLTDEATTIAEVGLFQHAGGGAIVDVSTPGIGRDPSALARVARATGLHVVMSTGFYVAATHPPGVAVASEEELARGMVAELSEGEVRAGIIKVGCSYPLTTNEEKVLRAAATAQRVTGAAIMIHVGRHDRSAHQIVGVLKKAGADLERAILAHLELRIEHLTTLDELARTGCYLEFDLFGHESSYYPLAPRDMPSDAQRLDLLAHVKKLGRLERILISHDICTKHRLVRYGGHGYGYILECVVPRMRSRGFSEAEIETILVKNPARVLAFAPARGGTAHG